MSLNKDAVIGAVVDCLSRIPLYTEVYGYESCIVQSDCEVFIKLCGGQHDPWGRYPDAYSFNLRSCLPLGTHGDNIEETLRQLWASQIEVFGPPYIQDSYPIVWNLSRFSTSYVDISGICCRIMDSWLSCEIGERASSRQYELIRVKLRDTEENLAYWQKRLEWVGNDDTNKRTFKYLITRAEAQQDALRWVLSLPEGKP